jgi:serine/threonine-protein kinase
LLLRISDIDKLELTKSEYAKLKRAAALDINFSVPVDFGLCNNGKNVYQLLKWVDGEDLETVLPKLSETEQYVLRLRAGEMLRKIHTLPATENVESWDVWFYRKVQDRIDFYNTNPIKSESGDLITRYLQDKKHLFVDRPQTFNHGDCNKTNLRVMPNGQIGAIDFSCYYKDKNQDHGDPWIEFIAVNWVGDLNPHFNTGMLNGYFDGEPPQDFFEVYAYYFAYHALEELCIMYEDGKPEDGMRYMANILCWLNNMQNTIPTWYLKEFYIQWIDGVPYKLKAPFDFAFIGKYGKVFTVFDDQDSGNICFGVNDGETKRFIKFAGAPTARANVSTEEAIERMKLTVPIYRDLAHPALTRMVGAEEIGGGFAMVFEWNNAECMGKQFPASRKKFMEMPNDARLRVFDEILDFHAHAAERGYVAIDFYDGSIMYDFNADKAVICDIELYEKAPAKNNMGRMYGSSRFMSPEEFQLGAMIDEITNVYTMGATAFALFGGERDRSLEKWRLSKNLYTVAIKAVSDERNERQQSIEQFIAEWRAATAWPNGWKRGYCNDARY